MRDTLDWIDTQHPGVIVKFGGHAMAAGLTVHAEKLEQFRTLFDLAVKRTLTESDLNGIILSDGELTPEAFSLHTAHQIRTGGPWGQNFPEPIFDGEFKVLHQKLVGEKHLKLMVEPLFKGFDTRLTLDAIAFNVDLRRWPDAAAKKVRLAYRLDINLFRGQESLQLMVEHIEGV
jgi:single-stranded-DNA-specific exonuclease